MKNITILNERNVIVMMYPLMTLDDNTEIVNSDYLAEGKVKDILKSKTRKIVTILHSQSCIKKYYEKY